MTFTIPTSSDHVAFSIALGVLLLSVVLHPIVRYCFYRIRAERAWKLIEKRQPVEVTKYSFFSEMLGDRGKWDTARIVALMIAAFHVSTWGLELTLDIAIRSDGPVDLLNRPPPVYSRVDVENLAEADWIVRKYSDVPDSGSLGAVHGTLEDGNATTTYSVDGKIIDGNTLFASWSPESGQVSSGLFYDVNGGQATVDAIDCTTMSKEGNVYLEDDADSWGSVKECESGPKVTDASFDDISSPPTILLNSTDGDVYLIVEEESSYPSFLYSVWMPGESDADSDSEELHHVFYISSTTRLVEAVVTGIVNGHIDGGSCVDLMTQYSLLNDDYSLLNGSVRISPFGEHPSSSYVERLDQVEPIVEGVKVGDIGTVCGALLIAVTAAAFLGCMFSHSGKSLDVYNRDELIRAVSLPGGQGADGTPAALKISVRQESDKAFSIIISDDGVYRGCDGVRKKLSCHRDAGSSISSTSRSISRSSSVPAGSRELTFDGVRPTLEEGVRPALRVDAKGSARSGGTPTRVVRTVELIASPVPSPAGVRQEDAIPRDTVRAAFHSSPSRRMQIREESETQILDDIEALPPNTSLVELRSGSTWEDARSVQLTVRQATPRVEMDMEEEAPKE